MKAPQFVSAFPEAEAAGTIAQHHLRIGVKLYGEGNPADAIAAFRQGLTVAEKAAPGTELTETVSELHARLGNVAAACGDFQLASNSYQAALRIAPHLTNCWCSFGDLHLRHGQHQTAIEFYFQALKLNPRHWASR